MQVFSYEYCEIFKNIYFEERLRATASLSRYSLPFKTPYCKYIKLLF